MGDAVRQHREEVFEELVGELDYPMLVVTAAAGGRLGGCLVGFATQTSISPARFMVCISRSNRTYRVARDAEYLGVHFLPADALELAELFGGETSDEVDKFALASWRPGPGGTPLLDGCPNRFVGRIAEFRNAGDHDAFLLEPVMSEHPEPLRPFPFRRAKAIDPGHEA